MSNGKEPLIGRSPRHALAFAATVVLSLVANADAVAAITQQISVDPFTNSTSQHQTAVEPDSFASGNTIVAAFQVGRFFNGGASGIGYATSTDGGHTWTTGLLPGVTRFTSPAGEFDRASDPNVAYDTVHGRWLISILAMHEASPNPISAIIVKRSPNGLDWGSPAVTVAPSTGAFAHDKNWAVCDNGAASPFRGRCYVSYTDLSRNSAITTRRSLDGGVSWTEPVASADSSVRGLGAFPVVRPDGAVVVPYLDAAHAVAEIRSTDGGTSFGSRIEIAGVTAQQPTGLRAPTLPSADVDAAGRLFVAWHDCRFRAGCPSAPNDIVYATSSDGVGWSSPVRVPIDDVGSTSDHFIPGLAVDPGTQGATARLGLTYYFYPSTACTFDTCLLEAAFVASTDGGATWSGPELLSTKPMPLSWIADTEQGRMVGDYVSTSFAADGTAVPVFSLADPFDSSFHQAIFAALLPPPGTAPAGPAPGTPSLPTPSASFSVTLAVSRHVVVYGQRVTLSGTVSSGKGNETVEIVRRFRVHTRSDGSWLRVIRPGISGSFRALWKGTLSSIVRIGVRPRIDLVAHGGLFHVKAHSVRSFGGRFVVVERHTRRGWRPLRRIRLDGFSEATFRAHAPTASRIRVVLPRSQAGRGYLAGISRSLVVGGR